MHKTWEALPPYEYLSASICKMPAVIVQIKQWINFPNQSTLDNSMGQILQLLQITSRA